MLRLHYEDETNGDIQIQDFWY